MYDAIVIGGSYAGMAAALQLARGRRKVAVLDAGQRRNRFAKSSHGLLGHDGEAPSAIINKAKAQLLKYPNLSWRDGAAAFADKNSEHFAVATHQNETLTARRLILATGVDDCLSEIPGLSERWGQSIFHCPYCHGYELDNGSLGVLASGEVSMHQALLIPEWGPTTLFTNGTFAPNEQQLKQLQVRKVSIERELVAEITGQQASVRLMDGRVIDLAGLFVAPGIKAASPLAEQLGCAFADSPLGPYVQTDGFQETSVSGVFACGDAARAAGNVTFAIADGAMAGIATHRSLIGDELV